jgi:oxepin-CoA hydrolase/3-oxo-5,6-dehydrosuberyl-CoA semialdehyde dehydrogenase
MPCVVKPASATAYLSEVLVRLVDASQVLPHGSLQLILGPPGDLLDRLGEGDVVTFTGSADPAFRLRSHPNILRRSVVFNAEADSLNSAILGPDVEPGAPEWDLMVREVVREMTVKAGQKCTAIRRVMVPRKHLEAMTQALSVRLAAVRIGDSRLAEVTMGALASAAQREDVVHQIVRLREDCEIAFDAGAGAKPLGEGLNLGAMMGPVLLRCAQPDIASALHAVEAFGPVSTLMPYEDLDHAVALAARGSGSLVASL